MVLAWHAGTDRRSEYPTAAESRRRFAGLDFLFEGLPHMRIDAGYEISFDCQQPTPMMLCVNVHPSRAGDLLTPGTITVAPANTLSTYSDKFGNICTRVTVPPGHTTIATGFQIADSGLPDEVNRHAVQHAVEDLPDDYLLFLLGSRYCETDRLMELAWQLFGHTQPGYERVSAVCDYVHRHIKFDYKTARPTRTAYDAYQEGIGVCRDYAHLAITFCRCLNIPARYCTGYLGDIGVPELPLPGDFSAWFDVYLGGQWFTFDARHNTPRIGRILMARGRDATDVAISTIFGPHALTHFNVWCREVT
jgi:transglutaminase-like putative cysteine protease